MDKLPAAIKIICPNIFIFTMNKESVAGIQNDIETGEVEDFDDWQIVEYTPFTEPFWGIIINK